MLMESFVAVCAIIAASIIDPGLYYAMNAPAGVVGDTVQSASQAVTELGFTISPGELQAAAASRRRADAGGPHRRRPDARDRHVADLLGRLRQQPPGVLLPLRDHVRGAVHPHHGRRRDARRALHAPGHAGQHLEADRARLVEARPVGHERDRRRGVGLLPLHRRHEPARRDQPAVPAVRHRQPVAGGRRAGGLHDAADQARQGQVGVGDRDPAGVGRDRHARRELPEGVLLQPEDRLLRAAQHVPGGDRRGQGAAAGQEHGPDARRS